uniref:Uncharacterized protein n=1 Tax=Pseudo-nitzschia australis TaxID=44445 RepID=A0A7S4EI37_9STRA|mmetsp:Transcript_26041/g.57068  ORF Transcript_26041/g.57068 Transcript_26041/m.57068 type:complete len:101 (-) Transcript_26041:124-426(-)|eukprot:CAMPEP_0168218788 /NCGR_PEP_ID=MMETSP0140_2-20121125/8135_1 /TAXON_ID=44445 /ORGANISM="Pseudo-nitzschia australis, Strain 10249 10 AB" /LENGTH=100 /DNA_ID=CAMNT_0008146969 /DNA_START=7 /DNA_END=312 /DNA_ORIENTATION=+
MTEGSPTPTPTPEEPPSTSTSTSTTTGATTSPMWELPSGIEHDIEHALFKTAVGAAAGGLLGLVFLRGGNGRRASAVATGIGVALGSTYERTRAKNNSSN